MFAPGLMYMVNRHRAGGAGPTNGPQCASCKRYEASSGGGGGAAAGSELTAANAAVGLRVHASGSGEHTGGGKLLGWKVGGVRHGDTSGGALLPALRAVPCMAWLGLRHWHSSPLTDGSDGAALVL